MQVSIVGRHVEITDAIQDYLQKRLQKLKKYFPMVMDVHVILYTQKFLQGADITIQASGLTLHGEEKSKDLYASIDMVIDKLDTQLKKHHDRIVRHHQKKKRPDKEALGLNISVFDRNSFELLEEPGTELPVIHTNRLTIKPMHVEEAMMQMDLVNEDFLIFMDISTNKIKVLYRRKDGDYGLVEPEY
ncbi:MAG: ribosome-associated translation inhibitor RaiA [bacterium]|jgi:putative sigma-54 modulation protein|nr:ribosome-associated translation inhibitor RaiA [bacterium]